VSNRPRRRHEGHLPVESDDAKPRRGGLLGWLFGDGSKDPDAPVSIVDVSSRAEAEVLAGFLRDKGIRAAVSADDDGGLYPNLATLRRVRVLVHQRDEARAKALIEETNPE
jgi:hypothetical protein